MIYNNMNCDRCGNESESMICRHCGFVVSKVNIEEDEFLSKETYTGFVIYYSFLKDDVIDIPDNGNCEFEVFAKVLDTNVSHIRKLINVNIEMDNSIKTDIRINLIGRYMKKNKDLYEEANRQIRDIFSTNYKLLLNTDFELDQNTKEYVNNTIRKKIIKEDNRGDMQIMYLIQDDTIFKNEIYSGLLDQYKELVKKYDDTDGKGLIWMNNSMKDIIFKEYPLVYVQFDFKNDNGSMICKRVNIFLDEIWKDVEKSFIFIAVKDGHHTDMIYGKSFKWEEIPDKMKEILTTKLIKNINK